MWGVLSCVAKSNPDLLGKRAKQGQEKADNNAPPTEFTLQFKMWEFISILNKKKKLFLSFTSLVGTVESIFIH